MSSQHVDDVDTSVRRPETNLKFEAPTTSYLDREEMTERLQVNINLNLPQGEKSGASKFKLKQVKVNSDY